VPKRKKKEKSTLKEQASSSLLIVIKLKDCWNMLYLAEMMQLTESQTCVLRSKSGSFISSSHSVKPVRIADPFRH
jgi:hypothetical protein